MQSTTEWAREHGRHFAFRTALDNYEPTRDYARGEGWTFDIPAEGEGVRRTGIVLGDVSMLKDNGRGSVYLIDDGRTVRVFYVAAYHPEGDHLILHPMPTNYDSEGEPVLRADNREPVSYGSWMLGPRRAYHLKVTFEASV